MNRPIIQACLGVAGLLCAILIVNTGVRADTALKEIFSVTKADYPERYKKGVLVQAFDISPDGAILAGEFESGEGQRPDGTRMVAVQVAEWDIATKRLVRLQQVDGPAPATEFSPNPQYTFDLRFAPDGQKLIAQTGRRILVLDAVKLTVLYSIASPEVHPSPPKGVAIRQFAVSGDAKWLAILSSPANSPCEPTEARLFSLDTGQQTAGWVLPVGACPHSISMSADGSQMLLSDFLIYPASTADLDLVESRTGKLLRSFDVGFGTGGSPFAVGGAQFIGQDQFIAQVVVHMDVPAELPKSTLVICDIHTGKLLHQLVYRVFGVRGVVAAASQAPVVAVLGYGPTHPEQPLRDDDTLGFERILLFHVNEREPFYVGSDRAPTEPTTHYNVSPSAVPLRISSDGRIIVVSEGDRIKVYAVADVI